jgi:hypothetical protein
MRFFMTVFHISFSLPRAWRPFVPLLSLFAFADVHRRRPLTNRSTAFFQLRGTSNRNIGRMSRLFFMKINQ